jgi:glycosyltransferase involved in cell wall biosynthesis
MTVLLLTQVLPYPPDSGPKVKTWNLLKWLARRHEVTLVSFTRGESAGALDAVRRHCHAVHTLPMVRGRLRDAWFLAASLLAAEPFTMRRDRRAAMHRLVEALGRVTRFDVVHADQLNMLQYASAARGARTVLDAHNALWLLTRRMAETAGLSLARPLLEREWRRLRAYEAAAGRVADAVLAVSEEDRRALADVMGPDVPITVVPIAVDTDEVQPLPRRADASRIVHVGTMFWPPNADAVRWFASEVFPRLRAARPDAAFDVIGARPPRAIRALMRPGSGVHVAGYVDDPAPYLQRAGAVVVPLRAGSGMRVKILSALAQGLPVVSTSVGCEGIAVRSGEHLLIADDPADFAAATLRLLADRTLADGLGRNGRRLIEARYDYRVVYPALEQVYGLAPRQRGAALRAGA